MPCIKCPSGKYKYGEHGKCVFDTLVACKKAAAAIHIGKSQYDDMFDDIATDFPGGSCDCSAELAAQFK